MKFNPPSKEDLIKAIDEFNAKNSCSIPYFIADSFINYYKQDDGRWLMANKKPLKCWKRALNSTWLPKLANKYKNKDKQKSFSFLARRGVLMDNAKEALKELFGISEVQAVAIEKLYFKAKTPKDILGFKKYYDLTMLKKQFVGTSYEKLSLVCAFAELDLNLRYKNIESFLEWLFISFSNRFIFQTKKGDFSYSFALRYYDGNIVYDELGKPVLKHVDCGDNLYFINANKELCDEQRKPLNVGEFYNKLVEYMFKNQDKIIFDNKIEISPVIKTQIPSQTKINKDYEQNYLEYKKNQNKLYNANIDKFTSKLEQILKAKK